MDVVACCHGEPVLQGTDVLLWPLPSCHVVLLYVEPGLCSANKDVWVCVCVLVPMLDLTVSIYLLSHTTSASKGCRKKER